MGVDLQWWTKYLAYFPLLPIILETTSLFKLLYTTQNQATLALALVIGLGSLDLRIVWVENWQTGANMKRLR